INPASWFWDFGDGATSTNQEPVHTYTNAGNYTVNLTVTNSYGSTIETKVNCIYAGKSEYSQNISYTAGDTAVHQQDVVIHRTDGTDYEETGNGTNTWHLYVGDLCKADYGDVRFNDAAGKELAYYIWPDFDSISARFCVRLEGADQPGTLAVLCGDAGMKTTSDGSATYLLFDHFDGPANVAPNSDIWESVKKGSSSATVKLDGNGNLLLAGAPNVISSGNAWTKPLLSRGVIIEYRDQISAKEYSDTCYGKGGVSGVFDKDANTWWHTGLLEAYAAWVQNAQMRGSCAIRRTQVSTEGDAEVLGVTTSALYPSLNTFYTHRFEVQNADLNFYRDGTLIASASDTTYSGDGFRLLFSQGEYKTGIGGTRTLDYALIRAYSATPPAVTNFKPVANFTANTTKGNTPLTVQFSDKSLSSPSVWAWDFGDNATSTEQHPSHEYTTAGNYSVKLTVTNAGGSDEELKTEYITVTGSSTPEGKADLIVSAITPQSNITAKTSCPIGVTLRNTGVGNAGAFNATLSVNDTLVDTLPVSGLASGSSADVSFSWIPISAGNYSLTVYADAENVVIESDETNNVLDCITVVEAAHGGIPPGVVISFEASPSALEFGELYPGRYSEPKYLTLKNTGSCSINVTAEVSDSSVRDALFSQGLLLDSLLWNEYSKIIGNENQASTAVTLRVPVGYSGFGNKKGTITFWAEAAE
ncbi:MAG: DUF2341 domain-containing protein, partial [Methanosarcinaceae archaeon]|nr:DUF2341 domain-containing protein [Methanosarcinaceae archaeon]